MNRQLSPNHHMASRFTSAGVNLLLIGFLYLLSISLLASAALAQQSSHTKVLGSVRDAAGKPVDFATILLIKVSSTTPADSQLATTDQLVKGAVADVNGQYVVENIAPGTVSDCRLIGGLPKTYVRALYRRI